MERSIWMIRAGAASILIAFFLPVIQVKIFVQLLSKSIFDIGEIFPSFYLIPVAMLSILVASFIWDYRIKRAEILWLVGSAVVLTILVVIIVIVQIQNDINQIGAISGGIFGGVLGGGLDILGFTDFGLPAGASLGSLAGSLIKDVIKPSYGAYLSIIGLFVLIIGWFLYLNARTTYSASVVSQDLLLVSPKLKQGPHLELIQGVLPQKVIPISTAQFSIGRSSKNNLQLPDSSASRMHASIKFAQGMWFLQDQNSTGGTFVNSQPIKALRLNSGDQIRIGNHTFIFRG